MALDRVVRWDYKHPGTGEIFCVLEDFFQGVGTVKWDKDRWFVSIPGSSSAILQAVSGGAYAHERWIEVWPSHECVYVITRHADQLTNSLARGFAELAARYWDGSFKESDL